MVVLEFGPRDNQWGIIIHCFLFVCFCFFFSRFQTDDGGSPGGGERL